MKAIKFKLRVIKSRFNSIKKEVLFLAIIAISSVLLLDVFLKSFPALNLFMYNIGQVYTKLCYSYFSAFIFYLLVVHFPRERRRVKSFRFLSNNIYYSQSC
jgi:hypothetical protein